MTKKTGHAIRREYLASLNISAGFNERSHVPASLLFEQRKRIAEDILKNGETEQNKEMYFYVNKRLKTYYGLLDDNE